MKNFFSKELINQLIDVKDLVTGLFILGIWKFGETVWSKVFLSAIKKIFEIIKHPELLDSLIRNLKKFLFVVWNPWARLVYFTTIVLLLALGVSFIQENLIIIAFFLIILFLSQGGRDIYILPSFTKDTDTFDQMPLDTKKWEIIAGSPEIDSTNGNPPPCLKLKATGNKINSFVTIKGKSFQNLIVECDILLTQNSLVNFVTGNLKNGSYQMARFDARPSNFNAILISDSGHNWRVIKNATSRTNPDKWHRVKVIFNKSEVIMYLNEKEILRHKDESWNLTGNLGVFNEVGNIFIDNFQYRHNSKD